MARLLRVHVDDEVRTYYKLSYTKLNGKEIQETLGTSSMLALTRLHVFSATESLSFQVPATHRGYLVTGMLGVP